LIEEHTHNPPHHEIHPSHRSRPHRHLTSPSIAFGRRCAFRVLKTPAGPSSGVLSFSASHFFIAMRTYDKLIATIRLRRSVASVRPGSGRRISRLHDTVRR